MIVAPMEAPGVALAVAFGRVLRRRGLVAPTPSVAAFALALHLVGLERRSRVLAAARGTLLARPEDRPRFEECFAAFFDAAGRVQVESVEEPSQALGLDEPATDDEVPAGDARAVLRFSPNETLRRKDFTLCTPEEMSEVDSAIRGLRLTGAPRRSRRWAPARRGGIDVRRTVRAARATGGHPLVIVRRGHTTRPRRVVLLVDVSGSMEPYSRTLVRLAHAAVVARREVEVFALGTRLTRLTRQLAV